jgi:hypothetical protein
MQYTESKGHVKGLFGIEVLDPALIVRGLIGRVYAHDSGYKAFEHISGTAYVQDTFPGQDTFS